MNILLLAKFYNFLQSSNDCSTQSYSSALRRPQGVDVITERQAIPSQTKQVCRTGLSQTIVSTQTDDPSSPAMPLARMCMHLWPVYGTWTSGPLHQNSPVRKQWRQSWSRSGSQTNLFGPITRSDHSGSYSDTMDTLADLPWTPKVKNIGRLKRILIKVL
jgi:hypothetical protein